MDKKAFMSKLKATFDGLIAQNKALASRIEALEHTCNEVIVGGLIDAAREYEDNENFSIFSDTYSEQLTPFAEPCKILNGEDYDIIEEMYAGSKDKEDVAAYVAEEISKLQSKLDALKSIGANKEVEVVVEEPKVEDNTVDGESGDGEVDAEELARIAKEML